MTQTYRIVGAGTPAAPGGPTDIASQLQGLVNQAGGLGGAGVGMASINGIGASISSLAGSLTGSASTIGGMISTLGTSLATSGMGSVTSLVASLQTQVTALMGLLNPAGMIAQTLHSHVLDAGKGIITSAFSGQHMTSWASSGISHISSAMVTSTAPSLPHNGNAPFSNIITALQGIFSSTGMTAPGFTISSDARLKSNVAPYPPALARIMKVQVKTFDKKQFHYDQECKATLSDEPPLPSFGFIAQEIRELFPAVVNDCDVTGYLTVDEAKVSIITLAAFQEFVTETRREIADLKAQLAAKG